MLTPKMEKIADHIANCMFYNYKPMDLELLFSPGLFPEDVIFQVLVLCCRYAYLINSEKHPVSYYIRRDGLEGDEAERVRKIYERIIEYIRGRDKLVNDRLEKNIGERFNGPDLNRIKKKNRYPEYSFTEFQYWETKNIHDMELVKAIVDRRIVSSNSVTESR